MFTRETFSARPLPLRDGTNDLVMMLLTDDKEVCSFMQLRVQGDERAR
jgi:hypothetical protein